MRRGWTNHERARAVTMRQAGATYAEIGQALGRGWKSIRRHLVDMGANGGVPAGGRPKPVDVERIRSLRTAGLSYRQIEREMGISDDTARRRLAA